MHILLHNNEQLSLIMDAVLVAAARLVDGYGTSFT